MKVETRRNVVRAVAGLTTFALGVGLFFAFVWTPWKLSREARSWREVPCLILSSELKEISGSSDAPESYTPVIRYSYDWNGASYESSRYYFGVFGGSEAKVKEILARYPPGSRSRAFVNHLDPKEAVLSKNVSVSLIPIMLSSALVTFGLFLLFARR